jgi:PAS domain S-box-containing protein
MSSITYPGDRQIDAVQVKDMLSRSIASYQTDKRFVRKNGDIVWTQVSGSLVWMKADVPHYFIYQIQNISDRVHAQAALRDSEERFRTIAEATQEWIWEIDADGNYTFSSPAVQAILGFAPEQMLGKSCLDIVAPNTRGTVADLLQRCRLEKRGWRHSLARQQRTAAVRCAGQRHRLPGSGAGHHATAAATGAHRAPEQDPGGLEQHQFHDRTRARSQRAAA